MASLGVSYLRWFVICKNFESPFIFRKWSIKAHLGSSRPNQLLQMDTTYPGCENNHNFPCSGQRMCHTNNALQNKGSNKKINLVKLGTLSTLPSLLSLGRICERIILYLVKIPQNKHIFKGF